MIRGAISVFRRPHSVTPLSGRVATAVEPLCPASLEVSLHAADGDRPRRGRKGPETHLWTGTVVHSAGAPESSICADESAADTGRPPRDLSNAGSPASMPASVVVEEPWIIGHFGRFPSVLRPQTEDSLWRPRTRVEAADRPQPPESVLPDTRSRPPRHLPAHCPRAVPGVHLRSVHFFGADGALSPTGTPHAPVLH